MKPDENAVNKSSGRETYTTEENTPMPYPVKNLPMSSEEVPAERIVNRK